jgi:hypothetical protein
MRFTCRSFGQSRFNPAIWIAIYFSIFTSTARHTYSHLSLLAGVIASTFILGSAATAIYICRRSKSA